MIRRTGYPRFYPSARFLVATRIFITMTTLAGNRMKFKKVMGNSELIAQTDARYERHIKAVRGSSRQFAAGASGRELL